jgi:hypothetical protein
VKGDVRSFVEGDTGSGKLLEGIRMGVPNNTAEQIRAARLFVASQAEGVGDCAMLLDMLGLMPTAGERAA